mgnify:CR=1 FL=1
METQKKSRLDQLLAEHYGYESRARARDAILRGCIRLDGRVATKPSQNANLNSTIEISDDALRYVSRAALKLVHALKIEPLALAGKTALDLGASTGGFTQVLLEQGIAKVFAIDVGSDQLHPSLQNDARIINIENLNARHLQRSDLNDERPDIVVSDLSFISLKLALPPALELAAPGADGIFLIKPQFEVGKKGLGSGGIVRDEGLIKKTVQDLHDWLNQQSGWQVLQIAPSPIEGGDGNKEFLMIARKNITS